MLKRVLPLVLVAIVSASCGKDSGSPTSPTSQSGNSPAIAITGDLNFGDVELGGSATRPFRVQNTGGAPLIINRFTIGSLADHFRVDWTNGQIAPGATQTVNLTFRPQATGPFNATLHAEGNYMIGTGNLAVSGRGIRTGPLWEGWGTGPYVFDMPTYIRRVRITAEYGGRCENFVVKVGGRLIVNVILGTCSVADSVGYNGVHAVTGGQVEVEHASGVNWRITEHRD